MVYIFGLHGEVRLGEVSENIFNDDVIRTGRCILRNFEGICNMQIQGFIFLNAKWPFTQRHSSSGFNAEALWLSGIDQIQLNIFFQTGCIACAISGDSRIFAPCIPCRIPFRL